MIPSLDSISDILTTASSDAALLQKCPRCKGGLSVVFIPGRKASLVVCCNQCRTRMNLDGVSPEPPWVAVLGTNFSTQDNMQEVASHAAPKKIS